MEIKIDKNKTGLVVIDLQKGIVGRDAKPNSAADVVARASALADSFRKNSMPVFLVHVGGSADGKDRLSPITDSANPWTSAKMPPDWSEIVPELGPYAGDQVILKKQWGAFYGTDLDLQLRRRGLDTIVLCGISTNIGVESTARFAFEYGYQQIFVKDACSAMSAEAHENSFSEIFSRMGRIRSAQDVLDCLAKN